MSKCALLYFVIGVTITTASYAFFNIPQQMLQMGSQMMAPQQNVVPSAQPCECRCITK
jgi:hypothetical protein